MSQEYVCLVHFEPRLLEQLGPEERASLDARSLAYDEELQRGGHLRAARALQGAEASLLVRVRSGAVSTTDGPFAETKEQLGGFILIQARDLNEAVRIAAGIPLAALGTVEVRPVYEIPRREGA